MIKEVELMKKKMINMMIIVGCVGVLGNTTSICALACEQDENRFINNHAVDVGGAIYFDGKYIMSDIPFVDNHSTNEGGAIYREENGIIRNVEPNANQFINNTSDYGKAIKIDTSCMEPDPNFHTA